MWFKSYHIFDGFDLLMEFHWGGSARKGAMVPCQVLYPRGRFSEKKLTQLMFTVGRGWGFGHKIELTKFIGVGCSLFTGNIYGERKGLRPCLKSKDYKNVIPG